MRTIVTSLILIAFSLTLNAQKTGIKDKKEFTESLITENCTFQTTGKTSYFILEPGFQLVLKGMDGKDSAMLIITVTNDIKKIGEIETRVVEENESVNGHTVEISRNYFAFCKENGSIYYFGEEVDIYKDDKIAGHEGAWVAEGKNKAGVAMPGLVLLGSRYYQEIAPGIAMDRAEIISITETMKTPAGDFKNVLVTEETSQIEIKAKEYKYYAPDIGLIRDEDLVLVKYGYVKTN